MKISITSDIHIDFWVGINGSVKKQQKIMRLLIEKLLPEEKADTLVIAGIGQIASYNNFVNEASIITAWAIVRELSNMFELDKAPMVFYNLIVNKTMSMIRQENVKTK